MPKSSRQHVLPRATTRPVTVADVAHTFPFKASLPTGGALPEEEALYTQNVSVDPKTGSRFPQEAHRAASERMRASVRRERLRLDETEEAPPSQHTSDVQHVADAPPSLTPAFDADVEKEVERRVAGRLSQPATTAPTQIPTPQASAAPSVTVRPVTIEDGDRLWDWIRADGDGGVAFLSRPMHTSIDLHGVMNAFITAESAGTAMIRAIYYEGGPQGDEHLGFLAFVPILTIERVAVLHLYLRTDVRGHLVQLMGPLAVQLAPSLLPSGYKVAVLGVDPVRTRLHRQALEPLGFVEQTVFVR